MTISKEQKSRLPAEKESYGKLPVFCHRRTKDFYNGGVHMVRAKPGVWSPSEVQGQSPGGDLRDEVLQKQKKNVKLQFLTFCYFLRRNVIKN